jgi:group I intron endonuclease
MVKKGTTGIYAIINMVNWKKYVGQAVDIKERNSIELSKLKGGYFSNHHLQNAFNKYGEENFIFIFLEECSEEKLNERERYHVKAAGWPDHGICYNNDEGGKCGGRHHPETIEKMKGAQKGEKHWNYGKKNPKHSEEMSGDNNWVRKLSPEEYDEECKRRSERMTGENNPMHSKKHKKESIKQMSETRTKKCASGEIVTWNKDKKCPQLTGENNGMYGKEHKKETVELISKIRIESGVAAGENNPNVKLNNSNLWTVKRMFQLGYSVKYIANLFNMGEASIYRIKQGKGWTHIEGPSNRTIPDKFKVLLRTDSL